MDNEKRLRVSVDVSQLRSVGRDVENMQRRIVENNNDIIRQQNDALNQLREQLNLLGQQNSEKGRQTATPTRPVVQPTPQPEGEDQETATPTRRRRKKQPEADISGERGESYQDRGTRAIDLSALLGVNQEGFRDIVEAISSGNSDLSDITKQILQNVQAGARALEGIQEGVFSIDETLYNQRGTSSVGGSGIQPIPVPTPSPVSAREETPITRERRENVQRGSDRSTATNIATRVISGVGATFQSPAAMGGGLISSLGGIVGEGLSLIPGVGGFLGGVTTAVANVMAGIFTTSVEKAMEAQKRTIPYAQTMGVSAGQAMRTAFGEGSYAAGALGMNVGEYIQRRAALIRAAGGKEGTVAPVPETQSLMAVQRLYGLSDRTVMGMQGAMRFARTEEGQTASSSAIIRSFEQTMKQLQIPLSEIASTMDESMTTFIRSADDILSRTGEIDAASIASIMRAVRLQTGMEGRQLERVQQAFMGQGISQDDVTQTLLLRATQQATGLTNPSEILAAMEDLSRGEGDKNIMKRFLESLKEISGGSLEMLRHLMRGAFTNLSYMDINKITGQGDIDFGEFYKKVDESRQALREQNDPTNRYEPTAAERTVTSGEKMMSTYENRMIGIGEANIDRLGKILNAINAMYTATANFPTALEKFISENKEKIKDGGMDLLSSAPYGIGMIPAALYKIGLKELVKSLASEDNK
ncbi:MAG: hypothetical protein SOY17_10365 [Evtepia sp.]|nr:hypothetical protein [Evtepia sp.]